MSLRHASPRFGARLRLRTPRGQNLVLMVLTALALVLMVVMTLAIGQQAREKAELQAIADTAAYNSATATARAFNMFAVLNRAAVSHWVALSSTQAWMAYGTARGILPNDVAPAQQAAELHLGIQRIETLQWKIWNQLYFDVYDRDLYGQQAIRQASGTAANGTPPAELYSGGNLGCREACHATQDQDGHAFNFDDTDLTETLQAVLGSRGHPLTYLDATVPGGAPLGTPPGVRALGFPSLEGAPTPGWSTAMGFFTDGAVTSDVRSRVAVSTHAPEAATLHHDLSPTKQYVEPGGPATAQEKLSRNTPRHQGIFRGGFGLADYSRYDTLGPPDLPQYGCSRAPNTVCALGPWNLYGMPKIAHVIFRDYGRRPYVNPWDMVVRFNFGQGGTGTTFATSGRPEGGSGLFRLQAGFAAGMAYYHRAGQLREPPNLLNPFWRSTLVPLDVDANGRGTPNHAASKGLYGAHHTQHWAAGFRSGDVSYLIRRAGGPNFAANPPGDQMIDVFDRAVVQTGFRGLP